MQKTALITGVAGQDGSYLAELLLEKGYAVHGLVRRSSHLNRSNIEQVLEKASRKGQTFELHYGDVVDAGCLTRIIKTCKPCEVYNLAAQSHVRISYDEPDYTSNVNAVGVLRLLECIKHSGLEPRFYQASTSELFGKVVETPQSETTPFHPRSPYAVAKLYGHWVTRNYREAYGMFAATGILFNHESPRRGENFVTRKITYSLAKIRAGLQGSLSLGNLDAQRDWGYAPDYVEAMWRMLQHDRPDDYVIATGETHSVRDFIEAAARVAGFDIAWEGNGVDEIGVDRATGRTIITIDPRYYRPAEVDLLLGNARKAHRDLGWKPVVRFETLVEIMMVADLKLLGAPNTSGRMIISGAFDRHHERNADHVASVVRTA
jgi:GDPmannose 4,6-dehydratase